MLFVVGLLFVLLLMALLFVCYKQFFSTTRIDTCGRPTLSVILMSSESRHAVYLQYPRKQIAAAAAAAAVAVAVAVAVVQGCRT